MAGRGNPNWVKGKSGNPGGRPKVVAEVKELARQYTTDAISALAEICKNPKAPPAARVAAAQALLDRGYGKPTQFIDATMHKGPLDDLSADELSRLIEALERDEAGVEAGSGAAAEPAEARNVPSVH